MEWLGEAIANDFKVEKKQVKKTLAHSYVHNSNL